MKQFSFTLSGTITVIIFALTFVCEIQREQIFDLIILLRVQSEMKIAQECDQEIKRKKSFYCFPKIKIDLSTFL